MLQEQQWQHDQQQQQQQQVCRQEAEDGDPRSFSPPPIVPVSRAARIQQLRSEHQRRHRERHGQYPQDDREEQYERQLQEYERQVGNVINCWLRIFTILLVTYYTKPTTFEEGEGAIVEQAIDVIYLVQEMYVLDAEH